jgi:hypothetical protein
MHVMMWGGGATCPSLNTFGKLAEQAVRARSKIKGKKIANQTYARFAGEDTIIVRLHKTDILKLHRDGSTDIAITDWATSPTTYSRLISIGDIVVRQRTIPAVNGYKLKNPNQTFISNGYRGQGPAYAYNTHVQGWIHRRADRTFDESTITPHTLDCIGNPKEMRKVMLHLGRVAKVLKGYAKIDGSENPYWKPESGGPNLSNWLLARYKTPLKDMDLAPYPVFMMGLENKVFGKWVKSNINSEIRNAMETIRYEIARREGWIGKHEVLKLG